MFGLPLRAEDAVSADGRFTLQRVVGQQAPPDARDLAVSPDGRLLAVLPRWGGLDILDGRTCHRLRSYGTKGDTCDVLAWDAGSSRVVVGSENGNVAAWSAAKGTRLWYEGSVADGEVVRLAVSPGGALVAVLVGKRAVEIRRLDSGALVQAYAPQAGEVVDVAWLPGDRHLAVATTDGSFLDVVPLPHAGLGPRIVGPPEALNTIAASPDGRLLAGITTSGSLLQWTIGGDATSPSKLGVVDPTGEAIYNRDGTVLLVASGGGLPTFRMFDTKRLTALGWQRGPGLQFLSTGDGTLWGLTESDHWRAWNWGKDTARVPASVARTGAVTDLPLSASGNMVAPAVGSGFILLPRAGAKMSPQLVASRGFVRALAFVDGGKGVAIATATRRLAVYSTAQGALVLTLPVLPESPHCLVSTPRNEVVVGGRSGMLLVQPLAAERKPRALTGHQGGVFALALSPDGSILASGGFDGTIRLWNLVGADGGRQTLENGAHIEGLAWDAHGAALLSVGEDGRLSRWDMKRGAARHSILAHKGGATSVAADGSLVLTVGADRTVRAWRAPALTPVGSVEVGFVPTYVGIDGSCVRVGGPRGQVIVYRFTER